VSVSLSYDPVCSSCGNADPLKMRVLLYRVGAPYRCDVCSHIGEPYPDFADSGVLVTF
jgi:hypothetical protein